MAKYLSEFYAAPDFIDELELLHIEMVTMQRWVQENNKRIVILFEGRDTAGKGGAIFRLTQFLNPRAMRIVALPVPTEIEKGQWFFQRYIKELPIPGEIVFFDRSWYNRALVEPVMGFCSDEQYDTFLEQVLPFEEMLIKDGITLIKFWFSISVNEQKERLKEREENPLKHWKLSTVDIEAQKMWKRYTTFKKAMFKATSTSWSPWVVIDGNYKELARVEAMKYLLNQIDYEGKSNNVDLFRNSDRVRIIEID